VGKADAVVNDLGVADVVGWGRGKARFKFLCGFGAENLHDGGVDGGGVEWAKGHNDIAVLLEVGPVEGSLFLIWAVHGNLVVAGFGVKADEEKTSTFTVVKIVKGVVAAWDRVKEGSGDTVQGAKVDAKAPNKVVDVVNVFLVWFGSEEAFGKPRTTKELTDMAVVEQGIDVFLNNWGFVDAVSGLLAFDGLGCTGVDAKFEAKHGSRGAFGVESVPVGLDDVE